MQRFFLFGMLLLSFVSCNQDSVSDSPFDELLSQPPYRELSENIEKHPRQDDLYFERAVLLNKNNQPVPALADFRKAWSLDKQERYAVGVSNVLLDQSPDSAISFLSGALKTLPESIFLRLTLARAFDAKGRTDEALAECDRLLAAEPSQVNALLLRAELQNRKGNSVEAIKSLEKAHEILPLNLEVSNKLIYQLAETKNPKLLVLADSLILLDTLKLHAEPFYVKGVYFTNINDRVNALRLFDQTIQRDHRFLNAYIEKGKILLDQKKTADAMKTFQLANTISPAFPDAWYWMGRTQVLMGRLEDAKLNFEKAFSLDKTFIEAKEAGDSISQ